MDIAAWVADAGGTFGFDDVGALGDVPSGLPKFVPQLDGNTVEAFDANLHWGAYAIGMRRWLSPTTYEVYPRYDGCSSAREAIQLAPDSPQMAVLVGYGEDPLGRSLSGPAGGLWGLWSVWLSRTGTWCSRRTPSDSLSAACQFPGAPVIDRHAPIPRRDRAE